MLSKEKRFKISFELFGLLPVQFRLKILTNKCYQQTLIKQYTTDDSKFNLNPHFVTNKL